MLRKGIFCALLLGTCIFVSAEIPNPAFGERKHQLSAHFGNSVRDGGNFENLYLGGVSYGQANDFFMLPGRRNFEFMTHRGFGRYSQYNQNIVAGFSQDLILPVFWMVYPKPLSRLYLGINLGIYIQSEMNERIGSRFTFGQRAFMGYRIIDELAVEFYGRHFSNGDLTEKNSGQDFLGLTVIWNFSSKGNKAL